MTDEQVERVARAIGDHIEEAHISHLMIAARAAIAAIQGWRDIATAPKGDTVFDVWYIEPEAHPGYRIANCHYRDNETFIDDSGNIIMKIFATHWMPLPEPPQEGKL